jgi:hypothetical protein
MASGNEWLRKRNSNLASNVSATQKVALVLLLVTFVSVTHSAGDGSRGPGWDYNSRAVGRINGIGRFTTEFRTHGHGLLRGLLENGQANDSTTNERPLAVKRDRLDPFNHFRKYRGGYNIQSKHYWGVFLSFLFETFLVLS